MLDHRRNEVNERQRQAKLWGRFPTLQAGGDGSCTNAADALDPGANYADDIRPYGCATQAIVYAASPPEDDLVAEIFQSEKIDPGGELYMGMAGKASGL
jgi:hypothetical protein